jgi:putative DNA primase/helicase
MLEGCLDWQEQGLTAPQIVTEATAEYLQDEDALSAWIDECGERDPRGRELATDLFSSFSQWAKR